MTFFAAAIARIVLHESKLCLRRQRQCRPWPVWAIQEDLRHQAGRWDVYRPRGRRHRLVSILARVSWGDDWRFSHRRLDSHRDFGEP